MPKERDGPTAIVDLLGNSFAARGVDVAQHDLRSFGREWP
jgi:hypothetical protein